MPLPEVHVQLLLQVQRARLARATDAQWHADATCEQYAQWKRDNARGDQAYEEYVAAHTKKCPSCHVPIEKNSGCNHMTCAKCRHEFCWLCLQPYTSTHFKNTACKQFS